MTIPPENCGSAGTVGKQLPTGGKPGSAKCWMGADGFSEACAGAGVMGSDIMRPVRVGAQARHGVQGFFKHPAHVRAGHGLPVSLAIAGAHGCVLGFDAATIARTCDGVRDAG